MVKSRRLGLRDLGDRDIIGGPSDVLAALSGCAFAAVLKEGFVVTWVSWQDSTKVQVTLEGVDRSIPRERKC